MVQYIVTPWRDHAELLNVRHQLYPESTPSSDVGGHPTTKEISQRLAVERVQMWVHRGSCPHLIESTALLMAVVLDDVSQQKVNRAAMAASATPRSGTGEGSVGVVSASDFAIRAAYATAFSRFVTGLLDSQQDKQKKMSMYSIAKTIGLPATFVELRHQATHEQLPSLLKLRAAAKKALGWIWEFYWKHLPPLAQNHMDSEMTVPAASITSSQRGQLDHSGTAASAPVVPGAVTVEQGSFTCEEVLTKYLERKIDEETAKAWLASWDQWELVRVTTRISEEHDDMKVVIHALRVVNALVEGTSPLLMQQPAAAESLGTDSDDATAKGKKRQSSDLKDDAVPRKGWVRYQASEWRAKPIGIV